MKYQTKGTCSTSIDVEVENGIIKFVRSMAAATEIFREFPTL